jgi:hypothetical protein
MFGLHFGRFFSQAHLVTLLLSFVKIERNYAPGRRDTERKDWGMPFLGCRFYLGIFYLKSKTFASQTWVGINLSRRLSRTVFTKLL